MTGFLGKYIVRVFLQICLLSLLIFVFYNNISTSLAQEPTGVQWDPSMHIPSPEETSSWFPDLAVDSQGRVHVIWNQTDHQAHIEPGKPAKDERVFYSMWDGQQWLQYNDIIPYPDANIIRTAMAIDSHDILHLFFYFTPPYSLFYKQAQAVEAFSAAAWTTPHLVNTRSYTYWSDVGIYQDTLHVVYDDAGDGDEESECSGCSDIYYRSSPDRGLTWSTPMALFPTNNIGSARPQMEIDKSGTIYLAWDEGWDRLSDYITPQRYSVYMHSTDGGNSWSPSTIVSYPNWTNAQLAVGNNGQGGVMLVWRTISPEYPGIYYMWSTDYGVSWSPPQMLPGVLARPWGNPWDFYDMSTDSAGHIHLVATGHLSTEDAKRPPSLFHFEWDGNDWSSPATLYKGSWYPEFPHLVIAQGNQLHVTWHIRVEPFEFDPPHQVWYAHGQSQAPAEAPIVQPTLTPTLVPSPTPTVLPTLTPRPPTPTPTLDPNLTRVSIPPGITGSIYTDTDDIILLVESLIPAVLIVIVVVFVVRARRS
jgi:hypothetical protein